MNRRKFLKRAAGATLGAGAAALGYTLLEARWLTISRADVSVKKLPPRFEGTSVALVTDVHLGPFISRSYVRSVVDATNALKPDLIALGGDYVHKSPVHIAPVFEELARLKAGMGVFGVLGNHDHWEDGPLSHECMRGAKIKDLTNDGVWLERGGDRLRLGGVGDLWCDVQRPDLALGDATPDDAAILLSHNPDFAERATDPRIGLILSGHTHGGQVVIPGYGAPILPSDYGRKYQQGWVQGPVAPVFVSRGVGMTGLPVRFLCRPEIVLLTLRTGVRASGDAVFHARGTGENLSTTAWETA